MNFDFPRHRREPRYDGIPEVTDAERAARQQGQNSAPAEPVCAGPEDPIAGTAVAAADPDPVLVSQLVRWGGMTEAEAIEALSKGPSNAV